MGQQARRRKQRTYRDFTPEEEMQFDWDGASDYDLGQYLAWKFGPDWEAVLNLDGDQAFDRYHALARLTYPDSEMATEEGRALMRAGWRAAEVWIGTRVLVMLRQHDLLKALENPPSKTKNRK